MSFPEDLSNLSGVCLDFSKVFMALSDFLCVFRNFSYDDFGLGFRHSRQRILFCGFGLLFIVFVQLQVRRPGRRGVYLQGADVDQTARDCAET